MTEPHVKNVVEAALLAAGRALSLDEICALFADAREEQREEVRASLLQLSEEYAPRGIELKEVASGYRIQIRGSMSESVSRLWQERPAKYSRAMLETLALVAYRQPITRGEIEQIRGVTVNPNIIKTLLERSWIRVVGHRDVPGKPELLGTTKDFLDHFGLKKLDDLPTLAELKQMEELRVQLALPGAQAAVMGAGAPPAPEAANENAHGSEAPSDAELEAAGDYAGSEPDQPEERAHGLVARGPNEDAF